MKTTKQLFLTFLFVIGCAQSALAMEEVNTPLTVAVARNGVAASRQLVANGADVNQCVRGVSPLHMATRNKNLEMCQLLLDAGAHADQPDVFGNTPLLIAAKRNTFDICKILLDAGANMFAKNKKGSCAFDIAAKRTKLTKPGIHHLYRLVQSNQYNIMTLEDLKQKALFIFFTLVEKQGTALFHALNQDNTIAAINILKNPGLAHGCNIANWQDRESGLRPIHWATMQNNKALFNLLLECGANVNLLDANRRTWQDHLVIRLQNQPASLKRDCALALLKCPPQKRAELLSQLDPVCFEKLVTEFPELVFDIEIDDAQEANLPINHEQLQIDEHENGAYGCQANCIFQ